LRLARFLAIIGVTLVVLSYVGPTIEPSYMVVSGLQSGLYRGYMVNAATDFDLRMVSWNDDSFSVYFMDYDNGKQALEDQSIENVTAMLSFHNVTSLYAHISIPAPGWYTLLVTPISNGTISSLHIEIDRPVPNPGFFLSGLSALLVGILWSLQISRNWTDGLLHRFRRNRHRERL